jgi:hypothetical protein
MTKKTTLAQRQHLPDLALVTILLVWAFEQPRVATFAHEQEPEKALHHLPAWSEHLRLDFLFPCHLLSSASRHKETALLHLVLGQATATSLRLPNHQHHQGRALPAECSRHPIMVYPRVLLLNRAGRTTTATDTLPPLCRVLPQETAPHRTPTGETLEALLCRQWLPTVRQQPPPPLLNRETVHTALLISLFQECHANASLAREPFRQYLEFLSTCILDTILTLLGTKQAHLETSSQAELRPTARAPSERGCTSLQEAWVAV